MEKVNYNNHPDNIELADYLSGSLSKFQHSYIEHHISACETCLNIIVQAYDSVGQQKNYSKKRKKFMQKGYFYLILTILSFALSFITPRYFLQFLVAAAILGMKWVADSKSTKMLIMIYDAWKKDGDRGASRILKTIESEENERR